MVNVSELTLAVVRFEGAQDTLALTKREAVGEPLPMLGLHGHRTAGGLGRT